MLDIAQEFGRVGLWERDLATGQGAGDRHVFAFWGSTRPGHARLRRGNRCSSPPGSLHGLRELLNTLGRHSQHYRVGAARRLDAPHPFAVGGEGRRPTAGRSASSA